MFYLLGRGLRGLFYGIDFVLFTALLYALSYAPAALTRRFYPRLFHAWCRSFVRALGVELRLHQHNIRPLPPQYLLIANHPSAFEDIGIPALFPVYSLAKAELRDWWFVGRIAMATGTLFVQREERESRRAAFDAIVDTLARGHNVVIYPEGGCKGRRIFETFRYGVFDISLRTGIPIVPVFLHYEAQEDFEWRPGEHLLLKLWHFLTTRNPRANYHVYDALDPAQFTSPEAYMQHVHGLYLQWQVRHLD
ncbi:MAG: 1-acyl-sn-glycerol-3-phosphate acyltransferase [Gammaproteobacteria bacterium]|nr:1-acyl-sn-glycerol-3-phosphate acyltransferase [Gammaproteobacteria bacterium]MDX5375527.1 1-acyl-sn-glycerol-3-phosphate acyltransferase [Gammaproteobacteria bacterium]